MLAKVRHYVPHNTLLNIYYAIFNSHLIYGCQIWGQKLSFYLNKLIKTQDKVLRIIHHKTRTEPVNPLYKSANVMKLQDYITILNCLFAYDTAICSRIIGLSKLCYNGIYFHSGG